MIAGLAKILYARRRDVASWGINGIGIALASGKEWSKLPMVIGNISTKSEKNPLVSSFEISADCPNTLPDSVAMGLKYEQHIYIAVTKEGRYLLIGSNKHDSKVTVKQDTGEVVGDFQGDKVVIEGVFYGRIPDVTALFVKLPTLDVNTRLLDSSVVGFDTLFSSLKTNPSLYYTDGGTGIAFGELTTLSYAKNKLWISNVASNKGVAPMINLEPHTSKNGTTGYDYANDYLYDVCGHVGRVKLSFDLVVVSQFDSKLILIKAWLYPDIKDDSNKLFDVTKNLVNSNGHYECIFDTQSRHFCMFNIYLLNPSFIAGGVSSYSIEISNLKVVAV